jgi:hypothetical protein
VTVFGKKVPKRGVHESIPLSELLKKGDKEINRMIRSGEVPTQFTDAKTLRTAARREKRQTERALGGDRHALDAVAGLAAGIRGGGTGNRNYQNIPLKERVHPAEYKRILEREAKRQGLI